MGFVEEEIVDRYRKPSKSQEEPWGNREGEITVASHRPTSQGPQNGDEGSLELTTRGTREQ